MCGSGELAVMANIANIQVFSSINFGFGSGEGVIPSVITTCKNCGNIQLFNAHALGVTKELNLPPADTLGPKTGEEGGANG